jgi:hypothetical protein
VPVADLLVGQLSAWAIRSSLTIATAQVTLAVRLRLVQATPNTRTGEAPYA